MVIRTQGKSSVNARQSSSVLCCLPELAAGGCPGKLDALPPHTYTEGK